MSTIKFEKGKFYKTRDGRKVECVHTNVGGTRPLLFAIDGEDSFFLQPDGRLYICEDTSEYDIISEWAEERVVWVFRSGLTGQVIASSDYQYVVNLISGAGVLRPHPQDSLTRVVIQDGHVDTE